MTLEESIMSNENVFSEQSELGEVMDNLDRDSPDDTGMSKIDFNTRLSDGSIRAVLVVEELQHLGILEGVTINNKIKRLMVSRDGLGRREKVAIVQGQREFTQGNGFLEKLGGMFKRRD
jgi:hypothetical protein